MRNNRQKYHFTKLSLITICILKLSTLQTSSADVQSFFSGATLSKKALRYTEQSAIIQSAPTKANDLPSVSDLLASAATDIENRLAARAADANNLAAKAKTSTTYASVGMRRLIFFWLVTSGRIRLFALRIPAGGPNFVKKPYFFDVFFIENEYFSAILYYFLTKCGGFLVNTAQLKTDL